MPYLGVDEQATYIDVECDGYILNFHQGTAVPEGYCRIYEPTKTAYYCSLFSDLSAYHFNGSTIVWTILINEPNLVCIKLERAETDIPEVDKRVIYCYCYPDHISIICEIVVTTSYLLPSQDRAYGIVAVQSINTVTNASGWNESSGSEVKVSSTGPDTAFGDYLCSIDDHRMFQLIPIWHDTGTGYYVQKYSWLMPFMRWDEGTLAVGTHAMGGTVVLDHIGRDDTTPSTAWSDTNYSVGDLVVNGSIGYECISAVTSGNSAVTEPGVGSGWSTYWVQCHRWTSTDRLSIGNEFTNISTDMTTTGTPVTDLNVPATIDLTSGFAADGAFHVKSDSGNAGKITWDRTRNLPAVVIEDWPIMSGDPASPTEHLLAWYKCDDNAANNTVVDSSGNSEDASLVTGSSKVARNTILSYSSTAIRGSALNLDATSQAWINIPKTGGIGSAFCLKGSVTFDIIMNSGTISSYLYLFSVMRYTYNSAGIRLAITTDKTFRLRFQNQATPKYTYSNVYEIEAGTSFTIHIWWDRANDIAGFKINSDVYRSGATGVAATSTTIGSLCIGADDDGPTAFSDAKFDNIKLYNTPILPYGSYIPANIISGDVDYSMAHDDITFYWDCTQDALRIGGASITRETAHSSYGSGGVDGNCFINDTYGSVSIANNSYVDPLAGKFSCWVSIDSTALSDDYIFYAAVDSGNYILLSLGGISGAWYFNGGYKAGSVYELVRDTTATFADDTWVHVELAWGNGIVCIYMNGMLLDSTAIEGTWVGTISTIHLMSRQEGSYELPGKLDNVTITSSPNTPQLWTANGKPLILPDFKSEVV